MPGATAAWGNPSAMGFQQYTSAEPQVKAQPCSVCSWLLSCQHNTEKTSDSSMAGENLGTYVERLHKNKTTTTKTENRAEYKERKSPILHIPIFSFVFV